MVARMVLRGIVAAWISLAIVAQSGVARADAAEVEALIAKGNELRRAGTPGPALPYFQKAYQLARTPRTAGQLGLAELAAGYPVEAEEHLSAALQSPNDPSIVKYRQMLSDSLTMARGQIGELAIAGNPAGATVAVNGRDVGILPLSSTIKVPARNTEIVVRASGYAEQRQFVPIAGGQRHELTFNLAKVEQPAEAAPVVVAAPAPAAAPSPAATPAAPAAAAVEQSATRNEAPSSTARTAAWIAGGGALVAAGTGLALQLAARSNNSDFNASCETEPTIHATGKALSNEQCQDRFDTWTWQRRWSLVGYSSGAALAVTSTVLFLVSRPTSAAPTTHAHLTCAPTANGISCQGVF
jgi:hypothetical protein